TLKYVKSVLVPIPPVRAKTSSAESPFHGKCNVRIMGVRVWLTFADESAYQGEITIDLTHSGPEQIVSQNDDLFSFVHEPIRKTFQYIAATKGIKQEPIFGSLAKDGMYGLVGPFTRWRIQVNPTQNVGLDISTITGATLVFRGASYDFTNETLARNR